MDSTKNPEISGPCNIDLFYFPMDTQYCYLIYQSYNYNAEQVRLQWNLKLEEAVYNISGPISLPDYDLIKMVEECIVSVGSSSFKKRRLMFDQYYI